MIPKLFYITIVLLSINLIIFLIKAIRARFYENKQNKIDELISAGKLSEANEKILVLAKKIPRDPHFHYSSAYLLWKENKIKEAIAQLKFSLSLNKKFALANFLMGYITFYNLGKKVDSVDYLEKAIKSNKKLFRGYNTLGIVYMSMNEHTKADEMFKKVIEYARDDKDKSYISDAYNNLGVLEIRKENYESAINNFKKALEINPDSVDVNINLGNIFGIRMDYSEAYECFKKAELLQNDNKFIKYWIGCLHYLEGEYEKSIEKLKEAINIDNEFSFAYLQMANSYKKLGLEEEAKKLWEKASSLNPQIHSGG